MKAFLYRARMSRTAASKASGQLALCCELYNAALQERRDAWSKCRVSVTASQQTAQLPEIKVLRPEVGEVGSQVLQDVIERLDKAYQAFFRRAGSGEKAGFPRFRSVKRYDSLTFKQCGWKIEGNKLTLQGIGTVRLVLHRPIEGQIKTVTIKRDACGDWFVVFACDGVPLKPLPPTGKSAGIDLGISTFVATSEGELLVNHRLLKSAEAGLKRCQRKVSRTKKGGSRQRKLQQTLARKHRHVKRQRLDLHHKTALYLLSRYDVVAVEDLNVKGLAGGMLAKSMHDVAPGQFISLLCAKAVDAARIVVKVDPRNTSRICSGCNALGSRKTLSERTHTCAECGLTLDRDINAARNILARALEMLAKGWKPAPPAKRKSRYRKAKTEDVASTEETVVPVRSGPSVSCSANRSDSVDLRNPCL